MSLTFIVKCLLFRAKRDNSWVKVTEQLPLLVIFSTAQYSIRSIPSQAPDEYCIFDCYWISSEYSRKCVPYFVYFYIDPCIFRQSGLSTIAFLLCDTLDTLLSQDRHLNVQAPELHTGWTGTSAPHSVHYVWMHELHARQHFSRRWARRGASSHDTNSKWVCYSWSNLYMNMRHSGGRLQTTCEGGL